MPGSWRPVVRDLHVGDPVGVSIQCSINVIAIVGKVEQIAQEADVGHSAARHHPVEDGHHIRGGAQRVWLGPAHRLQQYGCADSSCRLGGRRQLLEPSWSCSCGEELSTRLP